MSEHTHHTQEAAELFAAVWGEIENDAAAAGTALVFPKQIYWLNGAPGAGKGTHTGTLLRHLGFSTEPVVTSDLLKSPQARALIDAGKLVGDREVATLLLRRLLAPEFREGVIVDGFPRTAAQAEFLKLFREKLHFLHAAEPARFPKVGFHIVVLTVDEEESVRRQLQRGRAAAAAGEAVRKTDTDADLARNRYRIFVAETVEPLRKLRGVFPHHEINTVGEKPEVAARIVNALRS